MAHPFPEDEDNDFEMSFGKKDGDADYAKDLLEQRLDSMSWKVTLMAIVIPCLIGIIVVIGYFSIRQQVTTFQDTGSATVKEISGTMEAQVTALKKEYGLLAQRVEKTLPTVEKNAAAIDRAVKNLSATTATANKLTQATDAMQKDLAALTAETRRLAGELSTLTGQLKTAQETVAGFKAGLTKLETEKAGRNELERVLSNNEQTYTQKLEAAVAKLEQRIRDLEKRVSQLSQAGSAAKPPAAAAPAATTPGVATPPGIKEEPLQN
ncbi:MAG: hypothetical protein ACOZBW_00850 [Thermodesulfobacteriota bacterium]